MSPRMVRHKKRGSLYQVLGPAEGQISKPHMLEPIAGQKAGRFVAEGDELMIYVGENGKMFWRFPDEFEDGRFEDVQFERVTKDGDASERGGGGDDAEGAAPDSEPHRD